MLQTRRPVAEYFLWIPLKCAGARACESLTHRTDRQGAHAARSRPRLAIAASEDGQQLGVKNVKWSGAAALTHSLAEVVEPARRTGRWWRRRRHHLRLNRLSAYRRYANQQFDVLFHFPDAPVNLYHVRQWYGPLEKLAEQRTVGILCYEADSAEIIRAETSVPVLLIRGLVDMAHVREVHRPKVILYPNQNYTNFGILGLNTCQHAFICHGESDKIYMAANWVKAFNYDLVAGQAAKERLRQRLLDYDVEDRTIEIGRPQIDVDHRQPTFPSDHRTTVLYAPTWEADGVRCGTGRWPATVWIWWPLSSPTTAGG